MCDKADCSSVDWASKCLTSGSDANAHTHTHTRTLSFWYLKACLLRYRNHSPKHTHTHKPMCPLKRNEWRSHHTNHTKTRRQTRGRRRTTNGEGAQHRDAAWRSRLLWLLTRRGGGARKIDVVVVARWKHDGGAPSSVFVIWIWIWCCVEYHLYRGWFLAHTRVAIAMREYYCCWIAVLCV